MRSIQFKHVYFKTQNISVYCLWIHIHIQKEMYYIHDSGYLLSKGGGMNRVGSVSVWRLLIYW